MGPGIHDIGPSLRRYDVKGTPVFRHNKETTRDRNSYFYVGNNLVYDHKLDKTKAISAIENFELKRNKLSNKQFINLMGRL